MFLKVSMFALALCSVRADDLDCAHLLQPLEDQRPALAKYIIHAAGSNNVVISDLVEESSGSWIQISPAEEEDEYHVTAAHKLDDSCVYSRGVVNVIGTGTTMTLGSEYFDSEHKGVLLHTLGDDVDVWLHHDDYKLGNDHFKGKSITLFKRSKDVVVSSDTMEHFRRQAECEGIDVFELPADLCDDEPTE